MRNDDERILMEETVRDFLEGISAYENVKDRICFRLVNTERNWEFLEAAPHRDFMDLSAVYYVCFEVTGGRYASITVTDRMADEWGVTEEELWETAFINTQKNLPAETMRMEDAISAFWGNTAAAPEEGNGMVVATNIKKWYGAATIFYDDVLTRLTDILGERIFLLPSSVHEFIAIADDGSTDPAFLAEMVRGINRDMVSGRDFLSDSVYRYEKGGGITIAA